MKLRTGGKEKRRLSVLERQLEQAGAYGDDLPLADRKSRLFVVAGVLLGVTVGLLAILVVAFVAIRV